MAKIHKRPSVVLPLFDKLLQGDNIETDINTDQAVRVARESVRRDLEILLNTRPRYQSTPDGLNELQSSLIAYGLPNIQTEPMASDEQRERFRQRLESIIGRFEPRLQDLEVEIVEYDDQSHDRTLRFRIRATLDIASTFETVVYDTFVDLASGSLLFNDRGLGQR